MKKQTYMQFVESNKWFKERPLDRKSYITKISRLESSIRKDVTEGPAQTLLTFEEQNTIKEAVVILSRLKVSLNNAKHHVIEIEKQRSYEVVKVHRQKYRKLINENLLLDEESLVDVCIATMVILYMKTSNILAAERYAKLIENRINKGQITTEGLANFIITKYVEECDRLAFKFYSMNTQDIDFEQLSETINTGDKKKGEILQLYSTFFTELSKNLDL